MRIFRIKEVVFDKNQPVVFPLREARDRATRVVQKMDVHKVGREVSDGCPPPPHADSAGPDAAAETRTPDPLQGADGPSERTAPGDPGSSSDLPAPADGMSKGTPGPAPDVPDVGGGVHRLLKGQGNSRTTPTLLLNQSSGST